jgi:hypothetical protein
MSFHAEHESARESRSRRSRVSITCSRTSNGRRKSNAHMIAGYVRVGLCEHTASGESARLTRRRSRATSHRHRPESPLAAQGPFGRSSSLSSSAEVSRTQTQCTHSTAQRKYYYNYYSDTSSSALVRCTALVNMSVTTIAGIQPQRVPHRRYRSWLYPECTARNIGCGDGCSNVPCCSPLMGHTITNNGRRVTRSLVRHVKLLHVVLDLRTTFVR